MAKSKSTPRKSRAASASGPEPKPGESEGEAQAEPGAAPARARASASVSGATGATGATVATRRPRRAEPGARPASSVARAKTEAAEAESDEEDPHGDEAEGDEAEGADGLEGALDDGDVVEVVGELVDEGDAPDLGELDDEPAARPRRRGRDEAASVSPGAALSRTDPLQAYLREVQRHPLLTPEQEKELTLHYAKTGDVATAARLVTSNLRLVVKLAYEYRRAYKNVMDLIQEGNIGLMQAVKRYDPTRGVKLSSYAAWWIRAYILRFILNNWRLVKLGTTQAQRKLFFNLNKEKAKLSAMGIEPTHAEIAKRLSVDEKEVVAMDRRLSSGEASLDAPVGDSEGRPVSRLELLPSQGTGPDAAFEALEMGQLVQDRLQKFRETLKGKDVVIFDKRMAAEDPLTLQELGDEFGISRERVRQLEARLTGKLRTYLKEELGDAVGAE